MTEKTEEQVAKEKAAVDSMRNAKANMEATLSRIGTLERALSTAISHMRGHKDYVPTSAHLYGATGKTLHATIDEHIAEAARALG